MRARWFKVAVVVAVAALVAAGYLIGGGSTGGGEGSQADPAFDPDGLASRVATIHDALSGAGRITTLETERCPTQAAVGSGYVRAPSRVRVRMPARPSSHLVAYASSTGALLPAPASWECTASLGSDGTQEIDAGPIGSVTRKGPAGFPELRPGGPAARETLIPACAGCIATAICSFFPGSEVVKFYESEQPCEGKPEGELNFRVLPSAYVVFDPPGVRGAAAGSGGSLPSLGILSYTRFEGVRQFSCTLSAPDMDTCVEALVAFVGFGRRR